MRYPKWWYEKVSPLNRAIKISGGQVQLAEKLGVSKQLVHYWTTMKDGPPIEHWWKIEQATGVKVQCFLYWYRKKNGQVKARATKSKKDTATKFHLAQKDFSPIEFDVSE